MISRDYQKKVSITFPRAAQGRWDSPGVVSPSGPTRVDVIPLGRSAEAPLSQTAEKRVDVILSWGSVCPPCAEEG